MSTWKPEQVSQALGHLNRSDPRMKQLIRQVGPFQMKRQTNRYQSLLKAIVSQQISTAAARSIWKRIETLTGTPRITAAAIFVLTDEQLRSAGLSPQKLRYVRDLTERVQTRQLRLPRLHLLSDDEIIEELTAVKGIGIWTAQMFLMFSLGRPDVLPHGDLGIQSAIRNLYELPELPRRDECHRIAEPWRPYATIASWYLWRSLEFR